MSEFRKMQIASSQKSAKLENPLEKVGKKYRNNDSAKIREKQDFEKNTKKITANS
jgi:hypothetical protein